ncbi:hypothetical protein G3R48_12155 [Shewanella intestini]|uniref:Uncharacterized protein n=1 Tax=Shewanella intestini TaxID=2017544 RepID=A0ABS5I4U6_9GAMM|nr:hypothetical protein [Shewanella intestini]MRG36805.1 hypothetical protein [Shewanella sp. XMDDZSB0408]
MSVLGLSLFSVTTIVHASSDEKPRLKMTLKEKADEGRKASQQTERDQLQKARQAARETQAREQDILANQQPEEWESEQRKKAQAQFSERTSREQQYLEQAREAAKKERKIPEEETLAEKD